ncbi:MAG: AraC family transcriptional regulator, partial [Sphaerochaetaceae bacterium]
RLLLMEGGTFTLVGNMVKMLFPWPALQDTDVAIRKSGDICFVGEKSEKVPTMLPFVRFLDIQSVIKDMKSLEPYAAMALDAEKASFSMQLLVRAMETDETARKMPVLCFHCPEGFDKLSDALKSRFRSIPGGFIFIDGDKIPKGLEKLGIPSDFVMLPNVDAFESYARQRSAALFITTNTDASRLSVVRSFSQTPILVVAEKFDKDEVEELSAIPRLIIANLCVCDVGSFITRILSLVGGEEILPPLTGVLVKRAIVYLDKNATNQISRWQLAEAINVSEDYLTRIFRKELGLSPWDYLNRYRIFLATKLLRQTSLTINEVAGKSGFQDQAYFCRVFKKTMGVNPGKLRKETK